MGLATGGGAYTAVGRQPAADGDFLNAQAVDVAFALQFEPGSAVIDIAGEAAFIWGETELAPSVDFPVHDVRQLGAALRASADLGNYGFVLDFLYASGDSNFDDDVQSAFKADPNYQLGLLLFQHVLGAMSGRSVVTAFDADLSGFPSEDLDRISSQGSMSNTITLFPRAWYRPISWLEIYGGPLFALTVMDPADPFNSRIAGGDPRNSLNGDPGSYYGTEIDLGIRYRRIMEGTELIVGIEGGYFLPGNALVDADDNTMNSVAGLRGNVQYRF